MLPVDSGFYNRREIVPSPAPAPAIDRRKVARKRDIEKPQGKRDGEDASTGCLGANYQPILQWIVAEPVALTIPQWEESISLKERLREEYMVINRPVKAIFQEKIKGVQSSRITKETNDYGPNELRL